MAGLKFRILLDSSGKEEVFRDILISEEDNFESLYRAILKAYNFSSDQMASFYMSNESWDKGHEISLFDMSFGEDPDQIQPGVMKNSRIIDFMKESDQKIILVHDFLKMWMFLIELIERPNETPPIPKMVLAIGDAPDEESKSSDDENLKFETESDVEEEDEFGFGDFEDGFDY
mgnify:CR=1 FL=1